MPSPRKKSISRISIPSLRKISPVKALATLLVIFIVIASFLIGMLFTKVKYLESSAVSNTAQPQAAAPQQAPPAKAANIKDVNLKGRPFVGKENAPITVAYWFDFQCPFCKAFETDTLSKLMDKYVNTGKVKIVFKNYQFLGDDSATAGLAAQAVWELYPDQYFEWHQAMFNKQDDENAGFGTKDSVIELTRTIPGLDADKISALMDQKKTEYQKILDDDKSEGTDFGVNGTPGFILGKQLISGAEPYNAFQTVIDQLLK